jgi:hypothetical protein
MVGTTLAVETAHRLRERPRDRVRAATASAPVVAETHSRNR